MIRFPRGGKKTHRYSLLSTLHVLYSLGDLWKCTVTWKTRHITFKLSASCLLMNVNKAVSREEMRKRERGQERREGGAGGWRGEWRTHNYKSFISSENHKVSSQKGS